MSVKLILNPGIAKEFVVPGWRVGWLVIQDKGTGKLNEVAKGIKNLSQIVLGTSFLLLNTLILLIVTLCCI